MNLRTTASFATKEILRQFGNTENFLFGLLQPLRRDIVLPTAGGTPVVAAMHLVKQSIRQNTIKSPVFPIPIAALSVYLPTGSAGITRPLHGVLPPTCCAVRRSPSRDRSDTLSKRHLFIPIEFRLIMLAVPVTRDNRLHFTAKPTLCRLKVPRLLRIVPIEIPAPITFAPLVHGVLL